MSTYARSVATGLLVFVYGCTRAQSGGWTAPLTLALLVDPVRNWGDTPGNCANPR